MQPLSAVYKGKVQLSKTPVGKTWCTHRKQTECKNVLKLDGAACTQALIDYVQQQKHVMLPSGGCGNVPGWVFETIRRTNTKQHKTHQHTINQHNNNTKPTCDDEGCAAAFRRVKQPLSCRAVHSQKVDTATDGFARALRTASV